MSPTQVLLRWHVQSGVQVIPASSSDAHLAANLAVMRDSFPDLDPVSMALIETMDVLQPLPDLPR